MVFGVALARPTSHRLKAVKRASTPNLINKLVNLMISGGKRKRNFSKRVYITWIHS